MTYMTLRMIKSIMIVGIVALSAPVHASAITPDQWSIIKDGGIVKQLESVKGTDVKEGVAIGIVDAPPQQV